MYFSHSLIDSRGDKMADHSTGDGDGNLSIGPMEIIDAIKLICIKHSVKENNLLRFCLNKYTDKKTGNCYVLNNRCQCGRPAFCTTCEDFWLWEWDHATPHAECVPCNYLGKYYEAQMDLWRTYGSLIQEEESDIYSFQFQKRYSCIFGGQPAVTFEELELVIEELELVIP